MLHPIRFQRALTTQFWGRHLIQLCVVDSTNRILLEWSHGSKIPIPAGMVLVATRQQAGQGQYGRSWQSPAGGLYLSLLLTPETSVDQLLPLTLTLVWGVVEQLRTQLSLPIGVKWPNDLIYDGQKLGGLLLQTRSQGSQVRVAVAGLGLNVNTAVDPPGISLSEALGRLADLDQVAAWVLLGLEQGYQIWQGRGWEAVRDRYQAWMGHRQQVVALPDRTAATVLGVASTGALQVETQGGLILLEPGQIRLGYPARTAPSSEQQ